MQIKPLTVSTDEAARLLGVGARQIDSWIIAGRLVALDTDGGGKRRISLASILNLAAIPEAAVGPIIAAWMGLSTRPEQPSRPADSWVASTHRRTGNQPVYVPPSLEAIAEMNRLRADVERAKKRDRERSKEKR